MGKTKAEEAALRGIYGIPSTGTWIPNKESSASKFGTICSAYETQLRNEIYRLKEENKRLAESIINAKEGSKPVELIGDRDDRSFIVAHSPGGVEMAEQLVNKKLADFKAGMIKLLNDL